MIQHGANRDGFEQLLIWPIMSNAGHAGSCSKIIIKLLPRFVNPISSSEQTCMQIILFENTEAENSELIIIENP